MSETLTEDNGLPDWRNIEYWYDRYCAFESKPDLGLQLLIKTVCDDSEKSQDVRSVCSRLGIDIDELAMNQPIFPKLKSENEFAQWWHDLGDDLRNHFIKYYRPDSEQLAKDMEAIDRAMEPFIVRDAIADCLDDTSQQ